jgi:hypothetical protein
MHAIVKVIIILAALVDKREIDVYRMRLCREFFSMTARTW